MREYFRNRDFFVSEIHRNLSLQWEALAITKCMQLRICPTMRDFSHENKWIPAASVNYPPIFKRNRAPVCCITSYTAVKEIIWIGAPRENFLFLTLTESPWCILPKNTRLIQWNRYRRGLTLQPLSKPHQSQQIREKGQQFLDIAVCRQQVRIQKAHFYKPKNLPACLLCFSCWAIFGFWRQLKPGLTFFEFSIPIIGCPISQ